MSEPQFFDEGLEAMFDRAARDVRDDGFSGEVFRRLRRRARVRLVTVTGAGALGAAAAVSQFGNLLELYASKARALAGLLPMDAIADAANAAGGAGQTAAIVAVAAAFGLLAASGAMVLGRR